MMFQCLHSSILLHDCIESKTRKKENNVKDDLLQTDSKPISITLRSITLLTDSIMLIKDAKVKQTGPQPSPSAVKPAQ